MIDTLFMNEEDVERLCMKSTAITGKKWFWKKLGNKHNMSWEEVEEQLDIKINRDKLFMERMRLQDEENRRSREQRNELGTSTERSDSQGAQRNELPDGIEVGEPIVEIDGKKVRSGEAQNGSTTTEGSK